MSKLPLSTALPPSVPMSEDKQRYAALKAEFPHSYVRLKTAAANSSEHSEEGGQGANQAFWEACLQHFKSLLSAQQYQTWIAPLFFEA
ncbi:MAG: hypothetical protein RLZZ502_1386, partial [Pseudomonadota bacterium]